MVPIRDGRPQPLCSAFRREALPVVQAHIDVGDRAVMAVAGDLDGDRVAAQEWSGTDREGRSFESVNTPQELEAALERDRADVRRVAREDQRQLP